MCKRKKEANIVITQPSPRRRVSFMPIGKPSRQVFGLTGAFIPTNFCFPIRNEDQCIFLKCWFLFTAAGQFRSLTGFPIPPEPMGPGTVKYSYCI